MKEHLTDEQIADLLAIAESARSCWGFMSTDMAVPRIERDAARRSHDTAEALIASVKETLTAKPITKAGAEWFNKGRESVLRRNKSGCCCLFDEDDSLVSLCDAHREREDVLKGEVRVLKFKLGLSNNGWLGEKRRREKAEDELVAAKRA